MSTQPAPLYNPEPFNPQIYEDLKGDQGDIDYIDDATLENCNINDSTLTNCVFVGPIYSGPIKSKTYTIQNTSGIDDAALTADGTSNNNVDLNFLPGAGSTSSTAFTIKNNGTLEHNFDISGNVTHAGNVILNGANKTLQLNSTGGIYCGGAATTVTQQEVAYLSGATSNIQNQLNNLSTGTLTSSSTTNLVTTSGNVCVGNTNSAYKLDVDGNFRVRGGTGSTGAEFSIEDDPAKFAYSGFFPNKGLKVFWNYPDSGNGKTCFLNNGQGQATNNGFEFYKCASSQETPSYANVSCGELNVNGNVVINGTNNELTLNSTGGINCTGAGIIVSQQEISYLSGATSNIQNQINNISGNSQDLTPNSLTVTVTNPNIPNPTAGLKNVYNTSAVLTMTGSGYTNAFYGFIPTATKKVVVKSNYGSVPTAYLSLFEVHFNCNNGNAFYRTRYYLQIYPNRLWNNSNVGLFGQFGPIWQVNNNIDGNTNYNYTNATYAPNGRFYWTYDQNFSNYGGQANGWLVPQTDKFNILFTLPNDTDNWLWEIYVKCLDATDMTNNHGLSWSMNFDDISNW